MNDKMDPCRITTGSTLFEYRTHLFFNTRLILFYYQVHISFYSTRWTVHINHNHRKSCIRIFHSDLFVITIYILEDYLVIFIIALYIIYM